MLAPAAPALFPQEEAAAAISAAAAVVAAPAPRAAAVVVVAATVSFPAAPGWTVAEAVAAVRSKAVLEETTRRQALAGRMVVLPVAPAARTPTWAEPAPTIAWLQKKPPS